ncbi:MAG: DUF4112 domain-containing protein [Myxococcales bacterium]|nr:DUF4112 domain-containing protein [Myxococcales bacterium]
MKRVMPPEAPDPLARLRGLARLLDAAVTIPGVGVRVGLDALLGLVPVVGDWAGALLSAGIVVRAAGLGASAATLVRMLANVGLDLAVGAVPVLGDIFDVGFRANQRNLALLEDHLRDPAPRRRSDRLLVAAIVGGGLALLVGLLAATTWLFTRLIAAVTG